MISLELSWHVGVIVLLKAGFSQAARLSEDNTRGARLVGSLLYFWRPAMGEREGEGGRQMPVLEEKLKLLDFA